MCFLCFRKDSGIYVASSSKTIFSEHSRKVVLGADGEALYLDVEEHFKEEAAPDKHAIFSCSCLLFIYNPASVCVLPVKVRLVCVYLRLSHFFTCAWAG